MRRLGSDRSIAPLVAQFVPLKVETDNPASWSKWSRKYTAEGRGIPILYVIRADGQKLYAKSGPLSGPALPQMMQVTLSQSGRTFSDQQIMALEQAVAKAESALAADDTSAAVAALLPLAKLGPLGSLGSHAVGATRADQLVKQLSQQAEKTLAAAVAELSQGQGTVEAAVEFARVRSEFGRLPSLKTPLAEAARMIARSNDLAAVVRQAESLQRAINATRSSRTRQTGLQTLERLAAMETSPEIAKIAAAELQKLKGDEDGESEPADNSPKFRTWRDATGKFEVQAVLRAVQGDRVQLLKQDGTVVEVAIKQLSESDQRFVASQR